jgi:hypothetical protein
MLDRNPVISKVDRYLRVRLKRLAVKSKLV